MKKAFLCVTFLFLNTSAIAGITVEWNLAAAEAVLDALSEGSLDDDALAQLAALHGNRALIEKVAWAKPEVDAKYFVDAIEHARKGDRWKEDPFYLWQLMPYQEQIRERLDSLSPEREQLGARAAARLSAFLPQDFELETTVYVVIGGPSAGWTSGDGNLYLSLPH